MVGLTRVSSSKDTFDSKERQKEWESDDDWEKKGNEMRMRSFSLQKNVWDSEEKADESSDNRDSQNKVIDRWITHWLTKWEARMTERERKRPPSSTQLLRYTWDEKEWNNNIKRKEEEETKAKRVESRSHEVTSSCFFTSLFYSCDEWQEQESEESRRLFRINDTREAEGRTRDERRTDCVFESKSHSLDTAFSLFSRQKTSWGEERRGGGGETRKLSSQRNSHIDVHCTLHSMSLFLTHIATSSKHCNDTKKYTCMSVTSSLLFRKSPPPAASQDDWGSVSSLPLSLSSQSLSLLSLSRQLQFFSHPFLLNKEWFRKFFSHFCFFMKSKVREERPASSLATSLSQSLTSFSLFA